MIDNPACITQDMLLPSTAAGKVRVCYPRGSQTLLVIGADGVRITDPSQTSLDKDGAWQQAAVLPTGNLLYLSDTAEAVPTLVLGAGLKPL